VTAAGGPVAPRGPGVRRRSGGLLRHRDFRLLWIGQTTSTLGSSVTSVALPLVAVASLEASTFQVALLSAAAWLPWLLIGLPVGAWVDRLPRRPVMLACDLASLLFFLSVPVAAWLGRLSIGHLLAVALGAGTTSVVFQTAYQVYLPSLLDRDEVAEGNAKVQASEAAAQVGGPGVAGLITQLAGAANALLVDAASFLASAICLLSIQAREPRPVRARHDSTLRQEIGEGIRFVARDPYLRVLTVFGAASNIGLIGYQAILVVFLVREVGVSPGMVGGLTAATSLGGVLGATSATAAARRFGSARSLLVAELGAAPFGLLIPLTMPGTGLALTVAGGFVIGTGVAVGNVLKGSFRQTYTPHGLLGRVTVSMQLVNYGTIPLGAVLGGVLGTVLGVRPAIWIIMTGLALSGLILLVGPLRRNRDLPDQPAPRAGHLPADPERSPAAPPRPQTLPNLTDIPAQADR
jgi:MFS family permease